MACRVSHLVATLMVGSALVGSPAAASPLSFLSAEGRLIVDETGQSPPLRGVCLGSWLFIETWISGIDYPVHGRLYSTGAALGVGAETEQVLKEMGSSEGWGGEIPYVDEFEARLAGMVPPELAGEVADGARENPSLWDDSESPLREVLSQRFGEGGRDALLSTFHDAWVGESDMDFLAGMGMTLIRLPTTYRQILEVGPDDLPVEPVTLNEEVMARADQLISWASARGMYVTFDIQEAPGGQNDYAGQSTLYDDPHMQALTVDMWRALSARYKDEPAVAMYSLLAEPFSAPSVDVMVDLYDRLHDAIRAQGDQHLLVIHDGFKGVNQLPDPAELGWTDVVYSTHLFEFGMPPSYALYKGLIGVQARAFEYMQDRYEVPFYVGSFSTIEDERFAYRALDDYLDTFDAHQWPWTMWTYKRIDDPIDRQLYGVRTAWGIWRDPTPAWRRPDPWLDDYATLEGSFAAATTENLTLNNTLYDLLLDHLNGQ